MKLHHRSQSTKSNFHLLVPDLQWFAADAVEDGQETRLKGVLEHL